MNIREILSSNLDTLNKVEAIYAKYLANEKGFSFQSISHAVNELANSQGKSIHTRHSSNFKTIVTQTSKRHPKSDYLDFLLECALAVEAKLTNNSAKNTRALQSEFFELFHDRFIEIANSNHNIPQFRLQPEFFARRYHIPPRDVSQFQTAFPHVMMSIIDKKSYPAELISDATHYTTDTDTMFNSQWDDISNRDRESHRVRPSRWGEGWEIYLSKFHSTEVAQDPKERPVGVWLGHALSPYSDSLALYLELGKYLRFCHIFDLKPRIVLTDVDWAMNNHAARSLEEQGYNVYQNVGRCAAFRRTLYEHLSMQNSSKEGESQRKFNGITIESGTSSEIQSKYNDNISLTKLEKLTENYADLSKTIIETIFDSNFTIFDRSGKLIKENFTTLKQFLAAIDSGNIDTFVRDDSKRDNIKFLKYDFFSNSIKTITEILSAVLNRYKRLDRETFKYTFLQRYLQHRYSGSLKVGNKAEQNLDEMFLKFEIRENYQTTYQHSCLYWENYYFSNNKSEALLNVIAYTFPSGNLFSNFPNPTDAEKYSILIFDHTTEARRAKVSGLIEALDLPQIAIQMGDLLSFIAYFWAKELVLQSEHRSSNSPEDNEIGENEFVFEFNKLLKEYNSEFHYSFDYYTQNSSNFHFFYEKVNSSFYNDSILPYFFYPYIFANKAKDNKVEEQKFRALYTQMVLLTLKHVMLQIGGLDEWVKKF